MKIGIVYTGTTPELIDDVNKQIHKELGNNVELCLFKTGSQAYQSIFTGNYGWS